MYEGRMWAAADDVGGSSWRGSYLHHDNAAANTEDELKRLLHNEYEQQKDAVQRRRPSSSRSVYQHGVAAPRRFSSAKASYLRHPSYAASPAVEERFAAREGVTDGHGGLPRERLVKTLRRPATTLGPATRTPQPPPRHAPAAPAAPSCDSTLGYAAAAAAAATPALRLTPRKLPSDMFIHAFQFLDFRELCRVACVSRAWDLNSSADWLWRGVAKHHRSSRTPGEEQSWKQAFSLHICSVRSELDTEMAELLDIVKRSDRKLKESISHQTDPVKDMDLEGVKAKAIKLEGEVKQVKKQVAAAQGVQDTLQNLRDDQEALSGKLSSEVSSLRREVNLLATAERRALFLRRFQRRIISSCFEGSSEDEVPVALRRGTDTFSQMSLLATAAGEKPRWAQTWHAFTAFFPLHDTFWEVHDSLMQPPTSTDASASDVPEVAELNLPYQAGSKHDDLLSQMVNLASLSPAEVHVLVGPYRNKTCA